MITIARLRNIWLYGLTILGVSDCIQGTLGYLPLYLRGIGWAPASADGAASAFHLLSMTFVVPIALLSNKLGTRKGVLLAAAVMIALGVSLLSVAGGAGVWIAVCMAGMVRDGFMAVFMSAILETEGVGPAYVGTAMGMVMVFFWAGEFALSTARQQPGQRRPGAAFRFLGSNDPDGLRWYFSREGVQCTSCCED